MTTTRRDEVKYVFTPHRETLYQISEALSAAGICHELHVRPGYATIWAHPTQHNRVKEIAGDIDNAFLDNLDNLESSLLTQFEGLLKP